MKLFYSFASQEERRALGGSDFIELQCCRLPPETAIEALVAVDSICHWRGDSLYVYGDDAGVFWDEYEKIFSGGTYNNLQTGPMDLYGINYYAPDTLDGILTKLEAAKPTDRETLKPLLAEAKRHNGLYILGE